LTIPLSPFGVLKVRAKVAEKTKSRIAYADTVEGDGGGDEGVHRLGKNKNKPTVADLPFVNRELAERLLLLNQPKSKKKNRARDSDDDEDDEDDEDGGGGDESGDDSGEKQKTTKRKRKAKAKEGERELVGSLKRTEANPLGDDRFKQMFTSDDFEVRV
jgi:hypothetical protein